MSELELDLFPEAKQTRKDLTATFADNMSLPIHGWYRYTAGFSAAWVAEVIKKERLHGRTNVIDPFAGSGTVLLESDFAGVPSFGVEAHPYVYRIALAKLRWGLDPEELQLLTSDLLTRARQYEMPIDARVTPKLIAACYPDEVLVKLNALRTAWMEFNGTEEARNTLWFIITSILRVTSPVGTAQWQYVLPNRSKAKVIDPYVAFQTKSQAMCSDLRRVQKQVTERRRSIILQEDARDIASIPDGWGDLVITSPPYANNYDYADAMRLEMSFWGDIANYSDLQDLVRSRLVRACTQHVAGIGKDIAELLANERLEPIRQELTAVFKELETVRLTKGGKKNYHFMAAAYFKDLADVFHSLRRATRVGCRMCFVIGDSAPYGVYLPVDRWLGELAIHAGFTDYSFEKLRDRNVKWKNRKHRVPLKEGRLWING